MQFLIQRSHFPFLDKKADNGINTPVYWQVFSILVS